MPIIKALYEDLKNEASTNLLSKAVTGIVINLAQESLKQLDAFKRKPIVSSIPGKEYFVFQNNSKISRPINQGLFFHGIPNEYFQHFYNLELEKIPADEIQNVLYTLGMSYC